MNYHKGSVAITALIIILGVLVLGGAGYVAVQQGVFENMNGEAETATSTNESVNVETDTKVSVQAPTEVSIAWKFETMPEVDNMPQTKVTVLINGKSEFVGTYAGSCSEVGASGGVDGKGLLAGELAATQCWFAGGGDEIGVFAHEDGGYQIMVGTLEEPIEGSAGFRGDFKIKADIRI
jgi:hypothetical protein